MKFSLCGLFNRRRTQLVPLKDLAEAVKPFLWERGDDKFIHDEDAANAHADKPARPFNWDTDLTPAYVAQGWKDTAMWLQVAFADEKQKGDLYYSLHFALKGIQRTLERAEPADEVEIKAEHIALLKSARVQFEHAIDEFHKTAEIQRSGARLNVRFRSGTLASISPLSFRKMPGADHALVARQMRGIARHMDVFVDGLDVRPASIVQMMGRQPYHLRHDR